MGADLLIRLESVARVYPVGTLEVIALSGVSLDVPRGQFCAIVGPSGSGKSTLLNLLGTLDRPNAGRYLLDGQPIEALDDDDLARVRNERIGFVFQSFNLLPRETALANVELPLIYARVPRSERRRRAQRALERVGLRERIDHLPTQLSGGQQQRVAIARALVNDPLLLLCDEPTGALDSKTSAEVMRLLIELNREGVTIVLVTHDLGLAQHAARIISMQDGAIAKDELRASRPELRVAGLALAWESA